MTQYDINNHCKSFFFAGAARGRRFYWSSKRLWFREKRLYEAATETQPFFCLDAAWLNEIVVRAVALLSAQTKVWRI